MLSNNFDEVTKAKSQYEGEYIVLKYGGSIAAKSEYVQNIAQQVEFLRHHIGAKPIIVHGGKEQADAALKAKGFNANDKDPVTGLRITSEKMMPIFDNALRVLNVKNVADMNDVSDTARFEGFAGYDHSIALAESIAQCTGAITHINAEFFAQLHPSIVPLFYSACLNTKTVATESRLNVNADDMAVAIAKNVGAKRLFLLTDVDAVLDEESKPLKEICNERANELIQNGSANNGMIAKLRNAINAAKNLSCGKVVILNGQKTDMMTQEILRNQGVGTIVTYKRSLSP